MNCFMSYNPNVAKEVKITTWIKEFDGASPVYPSFPNDGDVFIVFDTDEAKEPSVNKTYTSGEWADTSSGGGGGGIGTIVTITLTTTEAYFNGQTTGNVQALLYNDGKGWIFEDNLAESDTSLTVLLLEESAYCLTVYSEPTVTGDATVKKSELYEEWEITVSGDCTITT